LKHGFFRSYGEAIHPSPERDFAANFFSALKAAEIPTCVISDASIAIFLRPKRPRGAALRPYAALLVIGLLSGPALGFRPMALRRSFLFGA